MESGREYKKYLTEQIDFSIEWMKHAIIDQTIHFINPPLHSGWIFLLAEGVRWKWEIEFIF